MGCVEAPRVLRAFGSQGRPGKTRGSHPKSTRHPRGGHARVTAQSPGVMELSPRDRARAAPRLPPARWEGRIQHGGGEPAGVLGQQPNPRGCPGRSSGEPHNIKEERKTKRAKGEALPPPVTPQMTRTPAQRKRRVPPASPSTQAGLPAPPNQLGPPKPTRLQLAPPIPAPSSRLHCTRGSAAAGSRRAQTYTATDGGRQTEPLGPSPPTSWVRHEGNVFFSPRKGSKPEPG